MKGEENFGRIEDVVLGESVQRGFEGLGDVGRSLLQGVQDRHECLARVGSGVGLGAEADFSGDDEGPKVSLGEVVVGWHVAVIGPMVKPVGVLAEDVLDCLDGGMPGASLDGLDDSVLDSSGLAFELPVGDGQGAEAHGGGQQGGKGFYEALDFGVAGEVLLQVLDRRSRWA